ncbi:MAG TPA: FGGY family carbohydrate kinase [Nitrospiria bacterium]|jgi:glycerol kinase
MKYILSVDQGSTHSKAGLVDEKGELVQSVSVPLRTFRPRPFWVEHRPEELIKSQNQAIQSLLQKSGKRGGRIIAMGLASQRSTIIVWEKDTGKPLAPALSWQDLRGSVEVEKYSGFGRLIRNKTGLLLSPHYAVLKLRWILKNVKGIREKLEKGKVLCGTVNSFLIWHWTRGDVHATDPTHAARMLLMDLKTQDWDSQLLGLFKIPKSILPSIQTSVSDFGSIKIGRLKISLKACIGDQQSALVGLGAISKKDAIINYGTGGFFLMNTGKNLVRLPGLLSSVGWSTPEEKVYALEGTVNSVGTVFDWLKKTGIISSPTEINQMIRASRHRSYLVPALAGLGTPHWLKKVQMGVLGLGPWTTKADLVRAAVEGIAFLVKDVNEVLRKDKNFNIQNIQASGGISHIDGLLQIQSDWLGIPVRRSNTSEGTLLGAGLLAGVGCGIWKSVYKIPKPKKGKLFLPNLSKKERDKIYQGWKKALRSVREFGLWE